MQDLKQIIAENIAQLRRDREITQADLAEQLNYSDKAVSKWERGESVPDIAVLKQIADLFGVKVDYLLTNEHTDDQFTAPKQSKHVRRNHILITAISIALVWLIATAIFVNIQIIVPTVQDHWLTFIVAIPVSLIVWLIFNAVWFNTKRNFLIISLLIWSILLLVYLCLLLFFDLNAWLWFCIGIPGQIIVLLWSGIRTGRKK